MEWKISPNPVPYEEAVAFMQARAGAIREGKAGELVWLLEHPALFTAGSGAQGADLIDTLGLPVYATGRGGQYTYHGPGQRVAYVMLDLKNHGEDVRLFVQKLEEWVIATLAALGVESFTREGRVGVWVDTDKPISNAGGVLDDDPFRGGAERGRTMLAPLKNNEAKIAAIGVRIRKWVSYHGISLNVNPDLSHYRGIVPCGIKEYGVTSLAGLGIKADMKTVDAQLMQSFDAVFGKQPSLASA